MSGGDKLDFEIRRNPQPVSDDERAALLVDPGFGRIFTDHMVTVRYAEHKGWYDARVEPRAPIPMDPASAVLHYAQEIFEGLKAYALPGGGISMFRPERNAQRFAESAHRLAMPPVPENLFIESLEQLLRLDSKWIPTSESSSLYLRPFMIATEVFLGVRPALEYLYCVIASPAGAYFKGGVKPITVWISEDYTRAAPGGTGAAKCGGNYAASLAPHAEALEHGCDQVIFLDAVERRYVDELGGMNVFFVMDDNTMITPPLTGAILAGITRDALITLAADRGITTLERPYSIDEWRADAASGRLVEAFACGTAAVITPIGYAKSHSETIAVSDGVAGPLSTSLRAELVDIQRGATEDRYGWVHRVV